MREGFGDAADALFDVLHRRGVRQAHEAGRVEPGAGNGGDAAFFEKAEKRLNRIIGDSHILVVASHSEFTLQRFCNKAALLKEGQLVMVGSVDEVLAAYREDRA